ncbi:MAG: hypothetical protein Q8P24_16455 [Desulfobacterales bacterium]|nr:hypothetical protein [Desulfobacterales bacterium]
MKTFIITEIKKAVARLKGTFVFVVKATFIAIVNVAFWLLPLFLMGYFTLKPIIGDWHHSAPPVATSAGVPVPPQEPIYPDKKPLDFESFLRTVRSFVRELRTLGR